MKNTLIDACSMMIEILTRAYLESRIDFDTYLANIEVKVDFLLINSL